MSTIPARTERPRATSEPAWAIAKLYPDQGYWSDGFEVDVTAALSVE